MPPMQGQPQMIPPQQLSQNMGQPPIGVPPQIPMMTEEMRKLDKLQMWKDELVKHLEIDDLSVTDTFEQVVKLPSGQQTANPNPQVPMPIGANTPMQGAPGQVPMPQQATSQDIAPQFTQNNQL